MCVVSLAAGPVGGGMESEREGGRSTNWRVDTAMCAPPFICKKYF